MSVFVIAEAGVNHNGSIEVAKKIIDEAKAAGVDAVKFQTFVSTKLVSKNAPKADYQKINTNNHTDTQLEMLKNLELSFDEFIELKEYCDSKGIVFLSTAFDDKSLNFLSTLDMPLYKIPSGELTNLPYLENVSKMGKKVLLSTGMATIEEISKSIEVLRNNGCNDICLLHCTTEYPAPIEEVNLLAMPLMKMLFNVDVGYSDHTEGIEVPIAAVALGATVIEKHFTLDKEMIGPDHKASLNPIELQQMVKAIKKVEKSLGTAKKEPSSIELKNRLVARKSIVASEHISKGDFFSKDNLTVKRPGNGVSPMLWYDIIGTVAKRDYEEDELIEL